MQTPSHKVTSIASAASAASRKGKLLSAARCVGVGRTQDPLLYAVKFERQLNNDELVLFSQKLMQMGDLSNAGIRPVQSLSRAIAQEVSPGADLAAEPDSPDASAASTTDAPESARAACPYHGYSFAACTPDCAGFPADGPAPD